MWALLHLVIKFFKRELYNGELSLLILSLVIATGSLSGIGFLITHIEHSMGEHVHQLNAAQLVLKSPSKIPDNWLQKAQSYHLQHAQMITFPSMLVINDEFKLAQIKAVSNNFPLLGELYIKKQSARILAKAPPHGEIWLDKRLAFFSEQAHSLELGEAKFKITGQLERVPGQSNALFSIAPSAMINLADIEKTNTLSMGSRAHYFYYFSTSSTAQQNQGTEEDLIQYQQWLTQKMNANQTLRTGVEDVKAVNTTLKKATHYLALASILTLILATIAIVINSHRYAQKQYKNNAIMLCLGFSEQQILIIELGKLLLVALVGSLLGILLGYVTFLILLSLLQDVLQNSPHQFYFTPVWISLVSGLFLLLTLSLANIARIRKLSPMGLIRNDLLSHKTIFEIINNKHYYLISFLGVLAISIVYSGSVQISLIFFISLFISALCLFFIAQFLLSHIIRIGRHWQWVNRLSLLNLERHKHTVLLQITSFSLIFTLITVIFLVRTELLDNWQNQFPEGTPNHFVINVQTAEKQAFKTYLQQHHISVEGLYPMVRGRLTHINNINVKQAVSKKAQTHNALHRELNLSVDNTLKYDKNSTQYPPLSIEKTLAKALDIHLNDHLTFKVGANSIEGVVVQLREVNWDSFQPNFYIVFPPDSIDQYPMTWITSFYLPSNNKSVLNAMMMQFSGITIIEIDAILKEVQFIINKVSLAIEVIFIFIVLAAFLILSASLSSTMAARMYENAIIRTLGASTQQLRNSLFIEFVVIALLSAVIALVLAEFSIYLLYQYIFNMSYHLHPHIWFWIILCSLILICGLGMLLLNKIFTQNAYVSLKQTV